MAEISQTDAVTMAAEIKGLIDQAADKIKMFDVGAMSAQTDAIDKPFVDAIIAKLLSATSAILAVQTELASIEGDIANVPATDHGNENGPVDPNPQPFDPNATAPGVETNPGPGPAADQTHG